LGESVEAPADQDGEEQTAGRANLSHSFTILAPNLGAARKRASLEAIGRAPTATGWLRRSLRNVAGPCKSASPAHDSECRRWRAVVGGRPADSSSLAPRPWFALSSGEPSRVTRGILWRTSTRASGAQS
jgi:hypothetical protein